MMVFCQPGTCSGGNSTPKSPRATITPSTASIILCRSSSAAGFSILAIMPACLPMIVRAATMSVTRWTNDKATQSTPFFSANSRSLRSFSVSGLVSRIISGKFTPLLLFSGPPTITLAVKLASSIVTTLNTNLPSSINSRAPGYMALNISGCGKPTRAALPVSVFISKTIWLPALTTMPSSTNPTRNFGPCKSTRIHVGMPVSTSMARMASIRAPWSACVPCEKFNRKTFTPASCNLRNLTESDEMLPIVATILVERAWIGSCGNAGMKLSFYFGNPRKV